MTMPTRTETTDKLSTKKYSELIVDALSNLQDKMGTDVKRITEFVANREMIPENEAKKMVQTTLHRGIQFGAIEKKPGGLFKLSDDFDKLVRQHRRRRRRRSRRRRRGRSRRRWRKRKCNKHGGRCGAKCSKKGHRRRGSCSRGCRRRRKGGDRRKWRCRSGTPDGSITGSKGKKEPKAIATAKEKVKVAKKWFG